MKPTITLILTCWAWDDTTFNWDDTSLHQKAGAWDNIDVSNPSPIIKKDGSVIMLYKGRGGKTQHMGIAYADSVRARTRVNKIPVPLDQVCCCRISDYRQ